MAQARKRASASARVQASREKAIEAGARRISIMLTPEAATTLDRLMARAAGSLTISQVIRAGIFCLEQRFKGEKPH